MAFFKNLMAASVVHIEAPNIVILQRQLSEASGSFGALTSHCSHDQLLSTELRIRWSRVYRMYGMFGVKNAQSLYSDFPDVK